MLRVRGHREPRVVLIPRHKRDVSVLIEAIDERGDTSGAGEHGAPLFEREVVLMIVERFDRGAVALVYRRG